MEAKLIRECKRLVRTRDRWTGKKKLVVETIPANTHIKGNRVHLLCLQGMAVPVCKECKERTNMTDEQIENAIVLYDKAELGIRPEDDDAYECGLMRGYRDEKWIPGPNYYEGAEDAYYSNDEDEEDDTNDE